MISEVVRFCCFGFVCCGVVFGVVGAEIGLICLFVQVLRLVVWVWVWVCFVFARFGGVA